VDRWRGNEIHLEEMWGGVVGRGGRSVAGLGDWGVVVVCCGLWVDLGMGGLLVEVAKRWSIVGEGDNSWDNADAGGMEVKFGVAGVARRIADVVVVNSSLANVDGEWSHRLDSLTFLSVLGRGCQLNLPFGRAARAVAGLAEWD
jgi:hypothetical protein